MENTESKGSVFRLIIWYSLVITLLLLVVGCLYWFLQDSVALPAIELSMLLLWGGIAWFSLMWLSPLIFRGWESMASIAARKKLPDTVRSHPAHIPQHLRHLTELKTYLRSQYGRFWFIKIKVLLVTGQPDDVEKLAPGLVAQYWLEDRGTVLLWGGIPAEAGEPHWPVGLHILRRKPLDGVVWVTTALAQPNELGKIDLSATLTADYLDNIINGLSTSYKQLGWRLPLYVWSLHSTEGDRQGRISQAVGCHLPESCTAEMLLARLQELVPLLTMQGAQQVCENTGDIFLLSLAEQLGQRPEAVSEPLATFLNPWHPLPLAGVMFSPPDKETRTVNHHWGKDQRWNELLEALPALPAGLRARKMGVNGSQVISAAALILIAILSAGMLLSFYLNRTAVTSALAQVQQATSERQTLPVRLQALYDLQQTLARLKYQQQKGAAWYSRFGLNQNDSLIDVLWPRYQHAALPLVRDAAAAHLSEQLTMLIRLPVDSPQREKMIKPAYDWLKLYLMLTRSDKMEAQTFAPLMMQAWSQRKGVTDGNWRAKGATLLHFYAENQPDNPEWLLQPDRQLVSQVRAILIRQMGMRNSESTLYQKLLTQVVNHYPDLSLAEMTGDTDARRLFSTNEVIPGMFTRQAWEDTVQPAIDKLAAERREEVDWVLSDSPAAAGKAASQSALKARLAERYFADYADSWLNFLNSLRWQKANTLSDAIDQLTLMADARQSPLVALLNTVSIEVQTGKSGVALSDKLVNSAKALFNREGKLAIDQSLEVNGPLEATFRPLLTLIEGQGQGERNLSLQTFLTRVTQVRLRLQQATSGVDPQAMTQALAQTVFQGKSVDLSATRDYGSLVAASLGQEWQSFGQTVFVQPMEQSWQKVLQPAAASLNAQWQTSVLTDWNSTFGGRYPFKNVSSEASLPLLGRFINSENGHITEFLRIRLNGVLHKEGRRWIPDSINSQGLRFNPAFLEAINLLSTLADVVFTNGEARLHFELRPGTAKGVMETNLIIDHQALDYFNQKPQWKRIVWPADTEASGARLSWISTQAGTRQYADLPGAWGWIRLLEKASITPYQGMSSSYSVNWKAQDGRPLTYILRTEAGEGPMTLLKLRGFVLPAQIFMVSNEAGKLTGIQQVEGLEAVYSQ